MTTADPNVGQLLSNRYKLVELIGKGAMGRVYRAEDVLLGGVMAVKFLSQTLLTSNMRDRFKREASTCAQLGQKSIHIVRVTDFGVNGDDIPFYVMEYLQGDGLSDVITSQQLMLPRFLSITRQICLGLQCAHQGIVINGAHCPIIHRDIKPSNILVSKDPGLGELVKVLDFGIAKLLQQDSEQTNTFMGTLAYSSPEQMEGKELDARSDIYSLGVMMFEMLTGKMPLQVETHAFGSWYKAHHFQPPRTFASVNPSLKSPKALETLVMSCLAKSPVDRPQSIAEVLKALEPLEQRYSANRQISHRIGEVLSRRPLESLEPSSRQETTSTREALKVAWPKDKPIAQIVFPQGYTTSHGTVAAVWVMLPEQEIQNLQIHQLYNKLYKNFLYAPSPHPMVLWVTAVHNKFQLREGPRWLLCYLDLKTAHGQEMTRLISEKGQYQLLLFALEDPNRCAHVITVSVRQAQCSQLQQWAITSMPLLSVGQSAISKQMLKTEFEKNVKPKALIEIESSSLNTSFNLSNNEL